MTVSLSHHLSGATFPAYTTHWTLCPVSVRKCVITMTELVLGAAISMLNICHSVSGSGDAVGET